MRESRWVSNDTGPNCARVLRICPRPDEPEITVGTRGVSAGCQAGRTKVWPYSYSNKPYSNEGHGQPREVNNSINRHGGVVSESLASTIMDVMSGMSVHILSCRAVISYQPETKASRHFALGQYRP